MSEFDQNDYKRLKSNYENKIQTLSEWLWENKPKQAEIEEWLNNFNSNDADREQLNALHQLSYFMSFELREIREMLKSIYRDHFIKPLVQQIKMSGTIDLKEIQNEIIINLNHTRFIGIGNSSESSSLLLYFFRQINELKKDYFIGEADIFQRDALGNTIGIVDNTKLLGTKHFIFMDDLSGSGSQAGQFFIKNKYNELKTTYKDANIYYFTLFNTSKSRKLFKEHLPDIEFKSVFELDETYKVFSEYSRYYKNLSKEKDFAQAVCKKYKDRYLHEDYLCGFDDSQLLLRFFYNIPDNTLPSFWTKTETWKPIFKRYDKLY